VLLSELAIATPNKKWPLLLHVSYLLAGNNPKKENSKNLKRKTNKAAAAAALSGYFSNITN